MPEKVLLSTDYKDLKLFKRGKVRDVYDLGEHLLIVSTDRISAFDVILPSGIPSKGQVLTAISLFWFEFTRDIIPNHLVTADVNRYPAQLDKYKGELEGRSMLVLKTNPLPVECVVPAGLEESDKLPEVIFTPSTKADVGHDINIDQDYVEKKVGKAVADKIKKTSIAIYQKASDYARSKGIIIADTKFEFGLYNNEVILIDEILTPDSSRFWPLDLYLPGASQPSFDKQFVRDYLESLDWDKMPPAPKLPDEVIKMTSQKYLEAYQRLTGKSLDNS